MHNDGFIYFIILLIIGMPVAGACVHSCGVDEGNRQMLQYLQPCERTLYGREVQHPGSVGGIQIWSCTSQGWVLL